jgi:hypothetical protein
VNWYWKNLLISLPSNAEHHSQDRKHPSCPKNEQAMMDQRVFWPQKCDQCHCGDVDVGVAEVDLDQQVGLDELANEPVGMQKRKPNQKNLHTLRGGGIFGLSIIGRFKAGGLS